jgi:tetratricopeptide (TPR) repeat protein
MTRPAGEQTLMRHGMRGPAVVLALLLFAIVAPACSRGGGAQDGAPFVAVSPESNAPTDRAIADAQARLRRDEDDPNAKLDLAQAFLQKVRETADPTLYTKADRLLDDVAERSPDDPRVLIAQGTLALARHEFTDALDIGRRALRVAPGNESAYGVVVDAYNELGRYDEALAAGDAMLQVRPDLAALSRASYARELRGDLDGAIVAMTQAVTAGSSGEGGENLASTQALLGDLLVTKGDLRQAAVAFDAAETSFPGLPSAQAGRARLLVAQGRYQEAADLLQDVLDVQPLAEHAIARGDALAAAGERREAKAAYALVDTIAELYEANGVDVDLELALFQADHRPGDGAVATARRASTTRPGIFGHDVLAWNLFRAGDVEEAATEIDRALVTGSRDPQLRFHAAAIADASGDRQAAATHLGIVLSTNPRFSAALADEVEALAERYGMAVPSPSVP